MENQPREVNVLYTRAEGFLLEIDGTPHDPFVIETDAYENPALSAEQAVRKALGIPDDAPLKLNITTDDDDLYRKTGDVVQWSDD